jgi:uncharacterized protein YlxW (UPF0749 family)
LFTGITIALSNDVPVIIFLGVIEFMLTQFKQKYQLALIILLAVNTVLVIFTYRAFTSTYPSASTRLGYKQEVARDLAHYNTRLATELNVLNQPAVREALAGFNYDVEVAASSDDLTQIILNQGRRTQEIILREAEAKLFDEILVLVNQDQNVQRAETIHLSLRITENIISTIPANFLLPSTLANIKEIVLRDRQTERSLEMEISGGTARLVTPYNPAEQLQTITVELDSLRLRLHELRVSSGLAEMTGPGIILYMYDQMGGTTTNSIIHDADIRDVVNELFGSGAQGISIGGQRLVVTSAIRCSGSLIKVNDKLITVNPVEIHVVGDPDLLISGLDIIRTSMEIKRGIRFEVSRSETIKLPAFVR